MEYLPWTILLVGLGIIFSTIIGFLMGIESAYYYKGLYDKSLLSINLLISGFPQFFIGSILLMIFSITYNIFPIAGAFTSGSDLKGIAYLKDVLYHLALPLLAIIISEMSRRYFIVRNTAITILKRPFITVGKAKGLNERMIKYTYVGKNSFFPLLITTAISIGNMMAGTILIENVFSYPGIGSLAYDAICSRDYPLIQGIFLLLAITVLVFNYLSEEIVDKYSRP